MCVAKSPIFAAPTVTVTPVVNFDEKLPIPALQRTSRVSPWQTGCSAQDDARKDFAGKRTHWPTTYDRPVIQLP